LNWSRKSSVTGSTRKKHSATPARNSPSENGRNLITYSRSCRNSPAAMNIQSCQKTQRLETTRPVTMQTRKKIDIVSSGPSEMTALRRSAMSWRLRICSDRGKSSRSGTTSPFRTSAGAGFRSGKTVVRALASSSAGTRTW
jgi:hypothetical protein